MTIAETIIQHIQPNAENYIVTQVQVGMIYSAVGLDNLATGVAYTFPKGKHCGTTDRLRPLSGRRASELVAYLAGNDLVLSSVALAAVNALLASEPQPRGAEPGDILEKLDIRKGDRVCMVGCFIPLMPALEKMQVTVTAVDEIAKPGSRPPEEAEQLLPQSEVAIITATSIINNTFDRLLELAKSCREIALLEPSTPLLKEPFVNTPVTCLSGIKVLEPDKVLQVIGEGGGFREFKEYCQKVNLRIDD